MTAPWSPMAEPPLPFRDDLLLDTCTHGYHAETCPQHGPVTHADVGALLSTIDRA